MQSLSSLSNDSQSTSSSSTNSSDRGRRIRKDALLKKWSKIKPFRQDSETLHIADILRKLEKLKEAVENVRMDLTPDSGQPSCIQCRAETPSDFSLLSDIMSGNLLERASEIEQKLMDISSGFMNRNGKEDMQAVEKLEREIRRIYPGCEKTVHVARRIDCNQEVHGEREASSQEQKTILDIETQNQDEQPQNIQFIVNKTADQNTYHRKKKNQFRQVVTTTEKIMRTDQQYVHMYDTILEDDGHGPFDRKILTQRSKTRFETIQGMDPTKEVLERRRITRFIDNRTKEVVELISDLGNQPETSKEPNNYLNAPPTSTLNSITGGSMMSVASNATWAFRQPLEDEAPKGDFKSRWNLVKSRAYLKKSDDSIFTESLLTGSSSSDNPSGESHFERYRSGIIMNQMKSKPQAPSIDKPVDVVYRKRSFDNDEFSDAFSRQQSFWVNTISYLGNEVPPVSRISSKRITGSKLQPSVSAFAEAYASERTTNKEPSWHSLSSCSASTSEYSSDLSSFYHKIDHTAASKHSISQPPARRSTNGQNLSSKQYSKYDSGQNMDESLVFSKNKGDPYSFRSQRISVRQSHGPSVYVVDLPAANDNKFIDDLENLSSNLPPLRHAEHAIINNMPFETPSLAQPHKKDDISVLNNNGAYIIKEPMSRLRQSSGFESTWTKVSTTKSEGVESKQGAQKSLGEVTFMPSFIISANLIPDNKPLPAERRKRRRKSKNKTNYVETSSNESNRSENEEFVGQMFLTSRPFCEPTPENLSRMTKMESFDGSTDLNNSNLSDSGSPDAQSAEVTKMYGIHDDFQDNLITQRSMQSTLYQNDPSSYATSSIYQRHLSTPIYGTDIGEKPEYGQLLKVSQHSGGSTAGTMNHNKWGFVNSSEKSIFDHQSLHHENQTSGNPPEQFASKLRHSSKDDNLRQSSAENYHLSSMQTVPKSKEEWKTKKLTRKPEDAVKITRIDLGTGKSIRHTETIQPQRSKQPAIMSTRSHAGEVSTEYHTSEPQLPIVFVVEPSTTHASVMTGEPVKSENSYQSSQHQDLTHSNLSYQTSKFLGSESTNISTGRHIPLKTLSKDFQNEPQAMEPPFYSSIFASEPSETFQSRTFEPSVVQNEKTGSLPEDLETANALYNKNPSPKGEKFTHNYAEKSNLDVNQIDHPSALWHSNINPPKAVKSNLPRTESMFQRPGTTSRSSRIISSAQPSEPSTRSVASKLTRDNASKASLHSIQHHPSMRSIPMSRQSVVQQSMLNRIIGGSNVQSRQQAASRSSGFSMKASESRRPEHPMPQSNQLAHQHSHRPVSHMDIHMSRAPSTAVKNTGAALETTNNVSRASLRNMQDRPSMRSIPISRQSAVQQSFLNSLIGVPNVQSGQQAAPPRPSGYSIKVSESRGRDRSMMQPTNSMVQNLHRSVSQMDIPSSPELATTLTNKAAASQTSFRSFEKPRIFHTHSAANLKELSTKEDIIQSLLTMEGQKSDESLIDHSESEILSVLYLDRDDPQESKAKEKSTEVHAESIVDTEETRGKAGESPMRLSKENEQIHQTDDLPSEHTGHSHAHKPMRKKKPTIKTRVEIHFPTDFTGIAPNPDEAMESGKKMGLGDRAVSFAHFPEVRSYVVDSDKPLRKFRSKPSVTSKQDTSSTMTISSTQASRTSIQQATGNTAGVTEQKEMPGRQRSGENVLPQKPECLSNKLAPYFEVLLQDDEAKIEESRVKCLENLAKKKQNDKVQPVVAATTSKPAVVSQQSRASTSKPPPDKPVSISNYNLDDLFQSDMMKVNQRKTELVKEKSKVTVPEIVVVKPPSEYNVSNVSKTTQETRSVIAANDKGNRPVQREERAPSKSNLQLTALFADTSSDVSERNVQSMESDKDVSVQNQQPSQIKSNLQPEEAKPTQRQSEIQVSKNNGTLLAQQQQQAAQSLIQTQRSNKERASQISTKQSTKAITEIIGPEPSMVKSPESLRASQSGSTISEEGSEQKELTPGVLNEPATSHLGYTDENSAPTRQPSTILEKVLSLINPLTSTFTTPNVPSQSNLRTASNISMKVPATIETAKSQSRNQLAGSAASVSAMNKDNQSKFKLTSTMALNEPAAVVEAVKSQTQSTQKSPSIAVSLRDDNLSKLRSTSKLFPVGTSKAALPNEIIPPVQGGASIGQAPPGPEPPTQADNKDAKMLIEQDDNNRENPAEPRLESGQQPEKELTIRPNFVGKSPAARKRELRRTIGKRPEPPKSFFATKFLSRFLSKPMTSEEELYRERRYLQIAVVDDPEEIPEGDSSMLERFRCYSVRSRTVHLTDSEVDVLCTKKAERIKKEARQLRRGRSRANFTLEYMSR